MGRRGRRGGEGEGIRNKGEKEGEREGGKKGGRERGRGGERGSGGYY